MEQYSLQKSTYFQAVHGVNNALDNLGIKAMLAGTPDVS